jgi:hypothetical protein
LVASEPLKPAWHDQIRLSNPTGTEYLVQFAGLHTHLESVVRNDGGDGPGQFKLIVPQYSTPEFLMPLVEEEFDTPSRCLVHLPPSQDDDETSGSLCVFLYEVCGLFHTFYLHTTVSCLQDYSTTTRQPRPQTSHRGA